IIDHADLLADADALPERADRRCRIAAPTRAGQGRHARIVPAVDQPVLHERDQLALAHDRVVEVAARELDLLRRAHYGMQAGLDQRLDQLRMMRQIDLADAPVVQRAVVLEYE